MAWSKRKPMERVKGECVRILDNEGKTLDRYTVLIGCKDASVFSMNSNPTHPQMGIGLYNGQRSEYGSDLRRLGKPIKFRNAPEGVRKYIRYIIEKYEEE